MRIRDIQIVLAVADTGSFTQAAEFVRLSQPAISLAVKRCQEVLGIRIFERHGREVVVSEEGAKVIEALRQMEDIFIATQKASPVARGSCRRNASSLGPVAGHELR